jgi:hypothetical protein
MMFQIPGLSWGASSYFPFNTISFQYEPTLKIEVPKKFYSRPNDTPNSIFGINNFISKIALGK